jgi:hypothetical protein
MNNIETNRFSSPTISRKWGFTSFSEKINGRVAMLGFTLLFLIELITKKSIFQSF